ncbi:hypothetical protein F5Y15DRAFT_424523 [Xylariaceae sp. FL0016]|nr:hypothetical protein F5Y15DRAFT_424523 [Xylariaceae sp. FL0016]
MSETKQISSLGLQVLHQPDEPGAPLLDIVLIHGFGGHPLRSWQSQIERPPCILRSKSMGRNGSLKDLFKKSTSSVKLQKSGSRLSLALANLTNQERNAVPETIFWPLDLLSEACPEARIMTWGYHFASINNKMVAAQPDIFQKARELLQELTDTREGDSAQHRALIFVAHSLGGLIALHIADTECIGPFKSLLFSTASVILFGTPHQGSERETLAEAIISMAGATSGVNKQDPTLQTLSGAYSKNLDVIGASFNRALTSKETACLKALFPAKIKDEDTKASPVLAFPGTCRWLHHTQEFRDWYTRESNAIGKVLMLTGDSGSGKSTILRHARHRIKTERGAHGNCIIYLNGQDESLGKILASFADGQSSDGVAMMLRWLLFEMSHHDARLRESVCSWVAVNGLDDNNLFQFFLDEYVGSRIGTPSRRTFLLIDAGNTHEASYFQELLCCLCLMAQDTNLSICVISNQVPYDMNCAPDGLAHLSIQEHNSVDIELFVDAHLRADWHERRVIVRKITKKSSGIFLWAELVTNLLNEIIDSHAEQDFVDQVLEELPADLHGLYEWVLGTLTEDERADALVLMRWVLLAPGSMRLNDLLVAVRITRTWVKEDITPEMVLQVGAPSSMRETQRRGKRFDTPSHFYSWMRSRTLGLLDVRGGVSDGGMAQESLGLQPVVPIHDSVRTFFQSGRGFAALARWPRPRDDNSSFIDDGHYVLLHTILTYLNALDLSPLGSGHQLPGQCLVPSDSELSTTWKKTAADQRNLVLASYPFLGYAVEHLVYHLLAPRFLRYFIPQQALLRVFRQDDCRIWRRWTGLLGETEAQAVLARCMSAAHLLRPEYGAYYRLERVFRAVNKMAMGAGCVSSRRLRTGEPPLPAPYVQMPAPNMPVFDEQSWPQVNTGRGAKSRGTIVLMRREM